MEKADLTNLLSVSVFGVSASPDGDSDGSGHFGAGALAVAEARGNPAVFCKCL